MRCKKRVTLRSSLLAAGSLFMQPPCFSNAGPFTLDGPQLFQLLDSIVEGIGEKNVVQVVTDGASNLVAAGKKLLEKITSHCIDLILEDIGELPVLYNTIDNAKKSTTYKYRHTWALNLNRKYSKGRELARLALTRFATYYLTLNCIQQQQNAIRSMFASEEWATSPHASKSEAKQVTSLVLSDARFWKSITYCLKEITLPDF
ncbi:hypothetical protein JHK85_040810 [Glycine max]|nr:hypothetical protein JHK85_040810 [Glycine max]